MKWKHQMFWLFLKIIDGGSRVMTMFIRHAWQSFTLENYFFRFLTLSTLTEWLVKWHGIWKQSHSQYFFLHSFSCQFWLFYCSAQLITRVNNIHNCHHSGGSIGAWRPPRSQLAKFNLPFFLYFTIFSLVVHALLY